MTKEREFFIGRICRESHCASQLSRINAGAYRAARLPPCLTYFTYTLKQLPPMNSRISELQGMMDSSAMGRKYLR